jgi:hypothetical protein
MSKVTGIDFKYTFPMDTTLTPLLLDESIVINNSTSSVKNAIEIGKIYEVESYYENINRYLQSY